MMPDQDTTTQQKIVQALLQKHGRTFAAELGAEITRNTPAPLFQLLCLCLLTGAPVRAGIAMDGAKALIKAGWTTPKKTRASTWRQRVRVLNRAGYARVDEKTASQLDALVETLLAEYDGDLRQLRQRADGEVKAARKALTQFNGIGDVGADIFLREVQAAWPEFYPFADAASLKAARKLGVPDQVDNLAQQVKQHDFTKLVAALVRTQLTNDFDGIRQAAR